MAEIDLLDVTLRFGATTAVDAVSLRVPSGAFFALLGPSGCGKTSLLRLLAGLERPDAGRIAIAGRTVADGATFVDPGMRGLGMVFQSYALWPHMTVAANIAFGLRMQRVSDRARRVAEAVRRVRVTVGRSHGDATPDDPAVAGEGRRASLLLDSDPQSPGAARRFLRDQLDAWQIDDDAVETAQLCLSELVTNALRYGLDTLPRHDGGTGERGLPPSAGAETATIWCGYMDGAVRSGERAAEETLDAEGWRL